MSNSKLPTSNATPEANASDTSAKTPKEKSADISVSVTVNGRVCTIMVEPRMTLLDALPEEPALTGTKKGCDRDECGTCTVHVDGRRGLSCMTLAAMQEGKRITTTEGVEREGQLHPLHAASIEHDGFQCGFCTSGQIISAVAMIEEAKAGWPSSATADLTRPFRGESIESIDPRADERQSLPLRLVSEYRRCYRRAGGEVPN